MSYCRFENTAKDLQDCVDNLFDEVSTRSEYKARQRLIKLAHEIVEQVSLDDIDDLPVDDEYLTKDGKEIE